MNMYWTELLIQESSMIIDLAFMWGILFTFGEEPLNKYVYSRR